MRGKHGVQCVCGICIRQRTSEEAEQMEGTVPDLTSCTVSRAVLCLGYLGTVVPSTMRAA